MAGVVRLAQGISYCLLESNHNLTAEHRELAEVYLIAY